MNKPEKVIALAAAMLERRDQVKLLAGDRYREHLKPWSDLLAQRCREHPGVPVAVVALEMAKACPTPMAGSWVVAALVEMDEATRAKANGPRLEMGKVAT